MMKREECFRILARHVKDEAVVATYSSAVDWVDLGPRVMNYTSIGAMGRDSSQGLGTRLMHLAPRVPTGAVAPKNLVHLVPQNDTYEANGSQPIPNSKIDF